MLLLCYIWRMKRGFVGVVVLGLTGLVYACGSSDPSSVPSAVVQGPEKKLPDAGPLVDAAEACTEAPLPDAGPPVDGGTSDGWATGFGSEAPETFVRGSEVDANGNTYVLTRLGAMESLRKNEITCIAADGHVRWVKSIVAGDGAQLANDVGGLSLGATRVFLGVRWSSGAEGGSIRVADKEITSTGSARSTAIVSLSMTDGSVAASVNLENTGFAYDRFRIGAGADNPVFSALFDSPVRIGTQTLAVGHHLVGLDSSLQCVRFDEMRENVRVTAITTATDGALVVAGSASADQAVFGEVAAPSPSAESSFVEKLDVLPALSARFVTRFQGAPSNVAENAGTIAMLGRSTGATSFGNGVTLPGSSAGASFVALFGADGRATAARAFGNLDVAGVAIARDGSIVLGSTLYASKAPQSYGGDDVTAQVEEEGLLVRYDASLVPQRALQLGASTSITALGVAPDDTIVFTGRKRKDESADLPNGHRAPAGFPLYAARLGL